MKSRPQLLVLCFILFATSLQLNAQKRYKKKHILKDLKELDGFKQSYVGFALYDPATGKTLACQNDSKYMTPASNTKLFTFYAGIKFLGKAVPALQYQIKGDSLIFWGTGNPLFLHPAVEDKAALDFLSARSEKLFYWKRPIIDDRFGPGWGWDDYNGYYSAEKAVFPIYGNSITTLLNRTKKNIVVEPDYFKPNFSENPNPLDNRSRVNRAEDENDFVYQIGEPGDTDVEEIDTLTRPFLYSDNLFIELLSDTLNRAVNFYHGLPQIGAARTLYSLPTDTLYKHMLQPSDNLFAEQILLMASGMKSDTLSTMATINQMKDEVFTDWTDDAAWVDGSGLSRYNMFTPRTMIKLLRTLREEVGEERLFELLPAGGKSGTIRNWYAGENGEPYVFAKTGTLSNNHTLSGYIKTDSGKTLIFTFMVNHYNHSTTQVRESMAIVLEKIKKAY